MADEVIDLIARLKDSINTLDLKYELLQNITDEDKSFAITALPGGRTIRGYMDGTKDKALPYEIRGKTKEPEVAEEELTRIAQYLEELTTLKSKNNSFEFIDIVVNDEPFFLDADDQAFFQFSVGFTANVTIF